MLEPIRLSKIALYMWSKNWMIATGLEIAVAWWIAAITAARLSSGQSILVSFSTRGFLKSDRLIVIQNAGIPWHVIRPLISECIFSFWEKDYGTCMPIAKTFCCSRQIVASSIFCLLASAFAAFSSWLAVKDAILLVVFYYFWCFMSSLCPRVDLRSCKTS